MIPAGMFPDDVIVGARADVRGYDGLQAVAWHDGQAVRHALYAPSELAAPLLHAGIAAICARLRAWEPLATEGVSLDLTVPVGGTASDVGVGVLHEPPRAAVTTLAGSLLAALESA